MNQAMGVGGTCEGAKQLPQTSRMQMEYAFEIEAMLKISGQLITLQM
jgi:hypothetical protein